MISVLNTGRFSFCLFVLVGCHLIRSSGNVIYLIVCFLYGKSTHLEVRFRKLYKEQVSRLHHVSPPQKKKEKKKETGRSIRGHP